MTVTQTKPQFLTEALIEVCNNEWKVLSLENGRSVYTQLEMELVANISKFGLILSLVMRDLMDVLAGCSLTRTTGECYKPASYKAPAKGVRYLITQLADNPHICDPYGSFLYL